jgi:hypothetical protein
MLKCTSSFFYSGGGGKSTGFRPDAPPQTALTDAARRVAEGPWRARYTRWDGTPSQTQLRSDAGEEGVGGLVDPEPFG